MVESIKIKEQGTDKEIIMDKINTEDYVLDFVDWGQAEAELFTSKYVNQVGVTITKSSFGSRDIVISGFVIADSEEEMTERKKFLNSFVNPEKQYAAIYKEYQIIFQPSRSIQYANEEETDNNEVMCKFRISGICPDPFFSLVDDINQKFAMYIGQFHFPLTMAEEIPVLFGTRLESQTAVIQNYGDTDVGMVFTFIANGGKVVNPSLTNITTGQGFKMEVEMQRGEMITVDTRIGSKNVKGGSPGAMTNFFKYKTFESQWLYLKKGLNKITFTADEGVSNLSVIIQYTSKYLEVQQCY